MNAILLDDEPLALRSLAFQLNRFEDMNILGTFSFPADAIVAAEKLRPDVAFIDIDMPDMNGIQVAEKLQDIDDSMVIVFVTAYEEYAVKAFELNALDYVLKPVQPSRLERTVQRLLEDNRLHKESRAVKEDTKAERVIVHCAGSMNVIGRDGEPLPWRTAKSRELFAYLVFKRGQPVRKETLLELLWPDTDEKKGFTQMYTTIYRLRKTFDAAGLSIRLLNSGDGYWLRIEDLAVDLLEWEEAIAQLPALSAESADAYQWQLDYYPGDYLDEHDYVWSEGERQRLRSLCYRQAVQLGRFWTSQGFGKKAADTYERLQRQFPFAEEIYEALIELYANEGHYSLAQRQYELLSDMMRSEYDSEPSEEAKKIYSRIRS
ncbi:response regulator [Cohnella faecalis]|nr:response regulator [Cohnella faecalis]